MKECTSEERIEKLCVKKGITVRRMCELAGIDFDDYYHAIYEDNPLYICYSWKGKIARALEVSEDELFPANAEFRNFARDLFREYEREQRKGE